MDTFLLLVVIACFLVAGVCIYKISMTCDRLSYDLDRLKHRCKELGQDRDKME